MVLQEILTKDQQKRRKNNMAKNNGTSRPSQKQGAPRNPDKGRKQAQQRIMGASRNTNRTTEKVQSGRLVIPRVFGATRNQIRKTQNRILN
jgi:hypothetical protein